MKASTTSGFPALPTEDAVIGVVRHALRRQLRARVTAWYVRQDNYVVAAVACQSPTAQLIVKLEVPGQRPNRHLDVMATIARLVRRHTTAPTFDVVAVDVSRRDWPWEYLIVTHLPGITWQSLYPTLQTPERASAQRQIGRSAAALHALRFDAFGELDPAGSVANGTAVVAALQQRALRRISTPRYRHVMLEVLETRSGMFGDESAATLCHEDLNPNNLVFELHDGQPVLSGILDFESAWASTGESDLARLELWWFTRGTAIRDGYTELGAISDSYPTRRPVLQLLWCLEYADVHPTVEHEAVTNAVCAELGIPPVRFHDSQAEPVDAKRTPT
ncbi:MAG: aminoglycoside phosphotransferase family protein [Chloroflexi bacterium]|nr:aminoglycoside phosphotransferase family protein [Chloroflexota bacterium]